MNLEISKAEQELLNSALRPYYFRLVKPIRGTPEGHKKFVEQLDALRRKIVNLT